MRPNHVLRAWRAGKQTIGAWLSVGNSFTAEQMASLGFDWVCLDMQHGLIDFEDVRAMLPAVSTTPTIPIVRVPWNDPWMCMKALDAGAYGVIVPLVNNAAEAARAVSACRYPPDGIRSFGPTRAALYGGRDYAEHANAEIACIVMIETAEGLAKVDEIVRTPGVDCVYIGPADLAYAIGLTPMTSAGNPEHAAAIRSIREACHAAGIAAGIHTASLEQTQGYLKDGFNMVTLGSESGFMTRLARQELSAARKEAHVEPIPTGY